MLRLLCPRSWGRHVGSAAFYNLVEFPAVKPDASALWAIVNLDALTIAHHKRNFTYRAWHSDGLVHMCLLLRIETASIIAGNAYLVSHAGAFKGAVSVDNRARHPHQRKNYDRQAQRYRQHIAHPLVFNPAAGFFFGYVDMIAIFVHYATPFEFEPNDLISVTDFRVR
jgi:hypothetical protein